MIIREKILLIPKTKKDCCLDGKYLWPSLQILTIPIVAIMKMAMKINVFKNIVIATLP